MSKNVNNNRTPKTTKAPHQLLREELDRVGKLDEEIRTSRHPREKRRIKAANLQAGDYNFELKSLSAPPQRSGYTIEKASKKAIQAARVNSQVARETLKASNFIRVRNNPKPFQKLFGNRAQVNILPKLGIIGSMNKLPKPSLPAILSSSGKVSNLNPSGNASKGLSMGLGHEQHGPVYTQNPIPYDNLNPIHKSMPKSSIEENARNYAIVMLEPERAAALDIKMGVIDRNLRSTYKFWTHQNIQLSTVANGSTYDLWVSIYSSHLSQVQQGTTFAGGIPTVWANKWDNPAYSSMSTWVLRKRIVSQVGQLRNLTSVQNQSGVCLQGNVDAYNGQTLTWSNLAQMTGMMTRTLGSPGDVGRVVWSPIGSAGSNASAPTLIQDQQWVLYNTPSAQNDTTILFWCQSEVAQKYLLSLWTLTEVLVLPQYESIYNPSFMLADPTEADLLVQNELNAHPRTSLERNVWKDDGEIQQVVSDCNDILGHGAGLAKSVMSGISSVGSFFGSLFGTAENCERVLALMGNKELVYLIQVLLKHNPQIDPLTFLSPTVQQLREQANEDREAYDKAVEETKEEKRLSPEEYEKSCYTLEELLKEPDDNRDVRRMFLETETIQVREEFADGTFGPLLTVEKRLGIDSEDQIVGPVDPPQPTPPTLTLAKRLPSSTTSSGSWGIVSNMTPKLVK